MRSTVSTLLKSDFFVCNKTTVKSYMTKTNEKSQQAFTCSKLTIETLEQGVKYVQNEQ